MSGEKTTELYVRVDGFAFAASSELEPAMGGIRCAYDELMGRSSL